MGSNKSAISATGKYSDCWITKNSYNFKQLIDFSKTTTWKIIKQTNANANHEMELVGQLSNLSLQKDKKKQTHETLLI